MYEYECNICHKTYNSEHWYLNHLQKIHQIDNTNDVGWNKNQLELAMELSMKEKFKDFIPDDDDVIEMSNSKVCSICMSDKAEIAFIPCGHISTCQKCSEHIKNDVRDNRKCPICRKYVKDLLKIYLI